MPFFFSFEQIWGAKAEIIPIEPDKVIFVRKMTSLNFYPVNIIIMRKFLLAVFISNVISSQEIINDTLQTTRQDLDEVIVKGIRAKFSSPISFTNVDKQI